MSSILAAALPTSAGSSYAPSSNAVEQAFTALRSYKPSSARALLVPLDEAVVAALAEPSSRRPLEERLDALLSEDVSNAAKEYVCRKLNLLGSAASVSALTKLLDDKDLGYSARAALQAIPGSEAVSALRAALSTTTGTAQVGIINSLRARRDVQSIAALAELLGSSDAQLASAAAAALGEIGTSSAASVLAKAHEKAPITVAQAMADARLVCADHLLASGEKTAALAIYKVLSESQQPKPIQLAAKRGLLQVMQAK
jgi:hypothetical protein